MLHPISSYRHHQVPVSVPPDSPTPVPMPASGPESNTVVFNQGDTIELVIHSPHKGSLGHRQPPGWLGSGSTGGGGGGDNDRDSHRHPVEEDYGTSRRQQGTTAGSTSSSNDYDDALSILSASELVAADGLHVAAATSAGGPQAEAEAAADDEGAPSGRLADAFADKWGAWVQDTRSSDDGSADGGGGRGKGCHSRGGVRSAGDAALGEEGNGGSGRGAREFDHEALLLSPFVPPPANVGRRTPNLEAGAVRGAAESEDDHGNRVASRASCPSSSSSIYDERWVWRRRDGVLPSSSSNDSSGLASSHCGSAVAEGQGYLPDLGENVFSGTAGGDTSDRRESELGVSSGTGIAGAVAVNAEGTASVVVPLDAARAQGASGGTTAASLREIDL